MTELDLSAFTIDSGYHKPGSKKLSALEMVSLLAGEEQSDHPACVCPVLAAYARVLNEELDDDDREAYFRPRLRLFLGTKSTREVERRRALYFADRAVRLFAPIGLRAAGLHEEADRLTKLLPIVDRKTAIAAAAPAQALKARTNWAADAANRAARAARAVETNYATWLASAADWSAKSGVEAAKELACDVLDHAVTIV